MSLYINFNQDRFCFHVFSSAIFQEDCNIVSGSRSPPQIVIKLRFSSFHSSLAVVMFLVYS